MSVSFIVKAIRLELWRILNDMQSTEDVFKTMVSIQNLANQLADIIKDSKKCPPTDE